MSKNNIEVKDFTKVSLDVPVPDLLDIQIASWLEFLQEDTLPEKRLNKGLESTFRNFSIFGSGIFICWNPISYYIKKFRSKQLKRC